MEDVKKIIIRPELSIPVIGKYCAGCRFTVYGQCTLFSVKLAIDQIRPYYSPVRCEQRLNAE